MIRNNINRNYQLIMKKFLFFVGFIFVSVNAQALSKEEADKLREFHDACQKETEVDTEIVKKTLNGEYVENDEKLKKQIFCVHKKIGFMDDSGNILEDVVSKKLVQKFPNEQVVKAAVKQCAIKKDAPEETAFQFAKCMHSYAPKDLKLESSFL